RADRASSRKRAGPADGHIAAALQSVDDQSAGGDGGKTGVGVVLRKYLGSGVELAYPARAGDQAIECGGAARIVNGQRTRAERHVPGPGQRAHDVAEIVQVEFAVRIDGD